MKKISFIVFVSLICFLQINLQFQFAATVKVKNNATETAKSNKNSQGINFRGENKIPTEKLSRSNKQEQQTSLWQPVSGDSFRGSNRLSSSQLQNYLVFQLNKTALTQILASVPAEEKIGEPKNESALESPVIMELPLPDGTLTRVEIEESFVLEPGLAAQFPEIKSYRGQYRIFARYAISRNELCRY